KNWSHPYIYQILQLTGSTYLVEHEELRIEKYEISLDDVLYTKYGNIYIRYRELQPDQIYERYFRYPAKRSPDEVRKVVEKYIDLSKIDQEKVKKLMETVDKSSTTHIM